VKKLPSLEVNNDDLDKYLKEDIHQYPNRSQNNNKEFIHVKEFSREE